MHALVAPVMEPAAVTGVGARAADSDALFAQEEGWHYHEEMRAIIIKATMTDGTASVDMSW